MPKKGTPPIIPTTQQAADEVGAIRGGVMTIGHTIERVDSSIMTKVLELIQTCGQSADSSLATLHNLVANQVTFAESKGSGATQFVQDCLVSGIAAAIYTANVALGSNLNLYTLGDSFEQEVVQAWTRAKELYDAQQQQVIVDTTQQQQATLPVTQQQPASQPIPPVATPIPIQAIPPITSPGPVQLQSTSSARVSPGDIAPVIDTTMGCCNCYTEDIIVNVPIGAFTNSAWFYGPYSVLEGDWVLHFDNTPTFAGSSKYEDCQWVGGDKVLAPFGVAGDDWRWILNPGGLFLVRDKLVGGKYGSAYPFNGSLKCDGTQMTFTDPNPGTSFAYYQLLPITAKAFGPTFSGSKDCGTVTPPPPPPPPPTPDAKCCPPAVINVPPCPAPIVNVKTNGDGECSGNEYDLSQPLLLMLSDADKDLRLKLPTFLGPLGVKLTTATTVFDLVSVVPASDFSGSLPIGSLLTVTP